MRVYLPFVVLAAIATLASCGEHEHEHEHEQSLDDEACEHMATGPGAQLTASADPGGAPSINQPHTRHEVAMVDFQGQKGGYVSFESTEAGDYVLFLSRKVAVSVIDASAASIAIEATQDPFAACAAIALSHTVPLGVGTYTQQLGPTSEPLVALLVERAVDEHAGHEH